MHWYKYFLSIFIVFFLLSCGDYNKIVKGDNYDQKLAKAEQLFKEKSYNRALVLYEQVYQRFPKDAKGELSYFKLGMTYYNLGDYYMSAYYFSNFAQRFPTSGMIEDAVFYSALSSVHNAPEPSLDQEDTEAAIRELQFFVSRFPTSNRVDTLNLVMDELRLRIETKAFMTVELYNRMERYNATVASAKAFLDEYPQSKYRLQVAFMLLDNAYILASRSVFSKKKERLEDVLKIAETYRDLFQTSKYLSKYLTISEKASRELEEVDEIDTFEQIVEFYNKSQTASKTKKMEYLEETLKLYYTFAQRYPTSSLMKRAEEIYQRAERERSSTYSY